MSHKYTITFVFATLLIDSIGFGIILPVMPQLIMGVSGEGLSSAARYGGWMMMVYAQMSPSLPLPGTPLPTAVGCFICS